MTEPIRILLVDGYAVVRDALRALITTAPDMEVVSEAADSARAVEQALQFKPDVIILDPSTLGSGSATAVTSIMKILPQPRILVLTNQINEQEVLAAIEAGVKGYLIKGTNPPEIFKAIRVLHQGKSAFDPVVTNNLL